MARVYFNENDPFAARWIGNIYPQAKVDTRSIEDAGLLQGDGGSRDSGQDGCGRMGNTLEQPCERQPGSISGTKEKGSGEWELDGHLHIGSEHAGSGMGQRTRQADGFWGTADWIFCRDGKWRRVESGTFPLSHGLSSFLGRLLDIERIAIREMLVYGAAKGYSGENLQSVREDIQEEASKQWDSGGCDGVHKKKVLLSFMRCLSSAHKRGQDGGGVKEASREVGRRSMRLLRDTQGVDCSSCGRKSHEQLCGQSSDPLCLLSLFLAQTAYSYWSIAKQAHATNCRTGRIRGYGNSIVVQLAAKFIEASMEAIQLNAIT